MSVQHQWHLRILTTGFWPRALWSLPAMDNHILSVIWTKPPPQLFLVVSCFCTNLLGFHVCHHFQRDVFNVGCVELVFRRRRCAFRERDTLHQVEYFLQSVVRHVDGEYGQFSTNFDPEKAKYLAAQNERYQFRFHAKHKNTVTKKFVFIKSYFSDSQKPVSHQWSIQVNKSYFSKTLKILSLLGFSSKCTSTTFEVHKSTPLHVTELTSAACGPVESPCWNSPTATWAAARASETAACFSSTSSLHRTWHTWLAHSSGWSCTFHTPSSSLRPEITEKKSSNAFFPDPKKSFQIKSHTKNSHGDFFLILQKTLRAKGKREK